MAVAAGSHDTPDLTARVRQAILTAEFVPLQRLIEADLMERFAASRGTTRTALLKLSEEGLVELLPNRGARVRAVSLAEAIEIVEVRTELEAMCASRAATRATADQLLELAALREDITTAFAAGDVDTYDALHQQMDRRIRELSGHTTALHLIDRLRAQAARQQFRASRSLHRESQSLTEHLAILDAVLARDSTRAAAEVRTHLGRIADDLRGLQ